MAEFQQSMALLGDELDEATVCCSSAGRSACGAWHVGGRLRLWPADGPLPLQVALIGDAMDVHGVITEAMFRDIVDAELLNSHSEIAKL